MRFEKVSFGYGGTKRVIDDLSLHIRPGETVALVGHTGSGKSSIAKLIARFYDPVRGSVGPGTGRLPSRNHGSCRVEVPGRAPTSARRRWRSA